MTGEIANWSRVASGHAYFSLRDPTSAVRCVMFRSALRTLRFTPENGGAVEVRGELDVYVRRGDWRRVFLVDTSIEVDDDQKGARVRTGAVLASGDDLKSVTDVAPTNAATKAVSVIPTGTVLRKNTCEKNRARAVTQTASKTKISAAAHASSAAQPPTTAL